MESFKSIAAINMAIASIDDKIGELDRTEKNIFNISNEFNGAWESSTATVVQGHVEQLSSDVESLKQSINAIKTKIDNAKNLAVAANETSFSNSSMGSSSSSANYIN